MKYYQKAIIVRDNMDKSIKTKLYKRITEGSISAYVAISILMSLGGTGSYIIPFSIAIVSTIIVSILVIRLDVWKMFAQLHNVIQSFVFRKPSNLNKDEVVYMTSIPIHFSTILLLLLYYRVLHFDNLEINTLGNTVDYFAISETLVSTYIPIIILLLFIGLILNQTIYFQLKHDNNVVRNILTSIIVTILIVSISTIIIISLRNMISGGRVLI
jgi:hypothetical protein